MHDRDEIDLLEGYEPRNILSIDLKSFYASVECIDRNLDPFTTPLVVCDPDRGDGTIVLAVSPYLKRLGVPGRCRRYELPRNIPDMIYAVPRMKRYLEKSVEVTSIYRKYVAKEDMHVYSIDESFLDVTHYLMAQGLTDVEYARMIIEDVRKNTGLTVCAGIGENIFLAKVAMDIGAKHKKDLFDKWTLDDVPFKLWPISPLSKVWGIGSRMEKRLNSMGMMTMGDIACCNPEILSKTFGIKGEELYLHANGIDRAIISKNEEKKPKSLSIGQVLFFDASRQEAIIIAKEMARALSKRLRQNGVAMNRLDLLFVGSDERPRIYKNGLRFERPVDVSSELESGIELLTCSCPNDMEIRSIYVVGSELISKSLIQSDLITDWNLHDREKRLDKTMDEIRNAFGNSSVMRCSSLLEHSTEKNRLMQIGGHRA